MSRAIIPFQEGGLDLKDLMGGKGANLGEMTKAGLPVPQGFTITTAACLEYYDSGQQLTEERKREISQALSALERQTGKKLGDPESSFGLCPFRCGHLHAGDDGYGFESRVER